MADTFTSSLANRKPEPGTYNNSWGVVMNAKFGSDLLDDAIVGAQSYSLTANKTLTRTNGEADEARMRVQNITGGDGAYQVTIPAVPIWYLVRNGSSYDQTITNGSNSVVVKAGNSLPVFSPDGSALYQVRCLDFGADLPKSSGTPSNATDLATKGYVDSVALSAALPGQSGNSGKVLTTNGSSASFGTVDITVATTGTLPASRGGTGLTALGTGVATWLGTPSSANLAAAMTDKTGTGSLVFANSPTLITPALGTPASGNLGNCTAFPAGSLGGLGSGVATLLATFTSANLRAALSDETGAGAAVFADAPTFTGRPVLPASVVGNASLNMPQGTAPTSPSNGDMWMTSAGLFVRANGLTIGPLVSGIRQLQADQTNVGAAAVTLTVPTTDCGNLLVTLKGLAPASSASLYVEIGNASTFYGPIEISGPWSSGTQSSGGIVIPGFARDVGLLMMAVDAGLTGNGFELNDVDFPILPWRISGGITRVRISTGGPNFTAGSTFGLWGY